MDSGPGSYEEIAAEYYSPALHPTSANFRTASEEFLRGWLTEHQAHCQERLCEVGCGDSMLAKLLRELHSDLRSVMLTDSSASMLRHSLRWLDDGAGVVRADARRLPLPPGSLTLVVSCLGDPYNDPAFWSEARRVLRPGGWAVYTTPAHIWSRRYRARTDCPEHLAAFTLADGRRLLMPSRVHDSRQQIDLIEGSGLRVVETAEIPLSALRGEISPKVMPEEGLPTTIVSCFVAQAPEAG